jgi:dihydrofolate reductase
MSAKAIKHPEVILILAMTESGLVGKGDKLPWKSSLDFKWFKHHTIGWPMLFGRNTANGMPEFPLKNRPCGIVSSKIQSPYAVGSNGVACVFPDLQSAYEMYKNFDKIFIAGGPTLYSSALDMSIEGPLIKKPFVDTIVKTVFPDGHVRGDKYLDTRAMELMSAPHFRLRHEENHIMNESEDGKFSYVSLDGTVVQNTGDSKTLTIRSPIALTHNAKATDTRFPKMKFQIWDRVKEK